jgi:hypothetical protein
MDTPMSLTITLDVDHTKFYVEDAPGHHIVVPCTEAGMHIMRRLLLAQKSAELADRRDPIALGQLAHWHRHGIGSAVMPTQQETEHNLYHETLKESCPFCRVIVAKRKDKPEVLGEDDLLEELTS